MKRFAAVLLIGVLGLVSLVGVAVAGGSAAPAAPVVQEEPQAERGWLGVRAVNLTGRIAERLEIEYMPGVVIVGVSEDSPAAEAGLQQGDVLAAVDSEPMETVRQVVTTIRGLAPGTVVTLTILRGGDELVVEATLSARPGTQPDSPQQRQRDPLHSYLRRIIGTNLPGNLLHAEFELMGGDGQAITIDLTAGRVQTVTDVNLIIVRKDDAVVEYQTDDSPRVIVGGHRIDLSGLPEGTPVVVVEKDGHVDLVLAWPGDYFRQPKKAQPRPLPAVAGQVAPPAIAISPDSLPTFDADELKVWLEDGRPASELREMARDAAKDLKKIGQERRALLRDAGLPSVGITV